MQCQHNRYKLFCAKDILSQVLDILGVYSDHFIKLCDECSDKRDAGVQQNTSDNVDDTSEKLTNYVT